MTQLIREPWTNDGSYSKEKCIVLRTETSAASRPIPEPPRKNRLDLFFKPKSVAAIGATEKAEHVGRAIGT